MLGEPAGRTASDLPTRHILRAALLAGRSLTAEAGTPLDQLPTSWTRTPSDGVFSPNELGMGCDVLIEARYIAVRGGLVAPTADLAWLLSASEDDACRDIIDRLFESRRPLWVSGATADGVVAAEMIPDAAVTALSQVFPDPDERELFLLAMGQRFSDADAKRTGDLAESHVTEACRAELRDAGRDDLADRVRRVSLTSDQLGYDITAPRLDESPRRLEVKGTRATGSALLVVLTRIEANVALRDPAWHLVVCRVTPNDEVAIIGWVARSLIEPRLPVDTTERGGWRTTAVPLDTAELEPGLPQI
jgi:hypothetical protein